MQNKDEILNNSPQIAFSLKEIVNVDERNCSNNNNVIKNRKKNIDININKIAINNKLEVKQNENKTNIIPNKNNLNSIIFDDKIANVINTIPYKSNNNINNSGRQQKQQKGHNYTNKILSDNSAPSTSTITTSSTHKRKYSEIKEKEVTINSNTPISIKINLSHRKSSQEYTNTSNINKKDNISSTNLLPSNIEIIEESKDNNIPFNKFHVHTNNNNNKSHCLLNNSNKNRNSDNNSTTTTNNNKNNNNIYNKNKEITKKNMFWDDFLGGPSSSSNSNSTNKNKGKRNSLTDEEYILYNIIDDDNVPLEFFTETSNKPKSETEIIDLENDHPSSVQDNYVYISDDESNNGDVVLISDGEEQNTNSHDTDNNNANNNDNISEDELLALRLQLEEEEEYRNRMAEFNRGDENNFSNFYDMDDFQIHSIYSALNDSFHSPMFMNSRGYVMDLRNYVEDDELDDSYEGLLRLEERIGNVKHNLNSNQINKNKTLKYNKDNKEIQEISCSICLLNYEEGDELRKLICTHSFHKECIDNWFKSSSTCPICRTDLKEKIKN